MSRYVLDANVFIEAKNKYYGFEICPGFWTSLVDLNKAKSVFCIDRIRDELVAQDDEIKDWVNTRSPKTFFKQTQDQAVIDTFQEMVQPLGLVRQQNVIEFTKVFVVQRSQVFL